MDNFIVIEVMPTLQYLHSQLQCKVEKLNIGINKQ